MTLIAALMIVSCDLTLGSSSNKPITGAYTIHYTELTAGTYKGVTKDESICYELILSDYDKEKNEANAVLNVYVKDPAAKEFPKDAAENYTGIYSHVGYNYERISDESKVNWTKNNHEDKLIFNSSKYDSYFSFDLLNPTNQSKDQFIKEFSPEIGKKVEFKPWEYATTSSQMADWMKDIEFTKIK